MIHAILHQLHAPLVGDFERTSTSVASGVTRLWPHSGKADLSLGQLPWSPAATACSGWPVPGGWPRMAPW